VFVNEEDSDNVAFLEELESMESGSGGQVVKQVEPVSERQVITRQEVEQHVECTDTGRPDKANKGLKISSGLAVKPLTKKNRRSRLKAKSSPWFVVVSGACFRCRRYVAPIDIKYHMPHAPLRPRFEQIAPLYGDVDAITWADLFHKMVKEIQMYFRLFLSESLAQNTEDDFLNCLTAKLDFRGLLVQPEWDEATLQALKTFANRHGYGLHPVKVCLCPPNSVMALADPTFLGKVLDLGGHALRNVLHHSLV
jgi:hypothetical protein